ncbi:D-alanine--D-alanine ligase family protein [candidate division KSB1 bacterium]
MNKNSISILKSGEKLNLAIFFGGRSSEHEVSLNTANNVIEAINKNLYNIILVGITQEGRWVTGENAEKMLQGKSFKINEEVYIPADPFSFRLAVIDKEENGKKNKYLEKIDVALPLLHGHYGEDGTIQGLFEMAGIPYVGAGVAASAVGMDKILMKNILIANRVPVVKSVHFTRKDWERDKDYLLKVLKDSFEMPVFAKPANTGSSVGITKVKNFTDLPGAVEFAAEFDMKILIEQGIDAREIEVSVLGNFEPAASVPGEVIPGREFYDYEAKYLDAGSELKIPAPLDNNMIQKIREMALVAFKALDCSGMARVDMFLEQGTDNLYVNEINTIPGFTAISMYPKLWEATGIKYSDLISKLIELAIDRWEEKQKNRTFL